MYDNTKASDSLTHSHELNYFDSTIKAKKWLDTNNVEYKFHDYRVDGLDKAWLVAAIKKLGWEQVLNKRGTTYRQLPQEVKDNLNEGTAIEQLLAAPAMIKRPILETNGELYLGFKDAEYQGIFG